MPLWYILRFSQCPQVKGGGRVEELKKSKRSTMGTREAKQEHMRGTTGDIRCTTEVQKMSSPGTTEVQQKPFTKLRIRNTYILYINIIYYTDQ